MQTVEVQTDRRTQLLDVTSAIRAAISGNQGAVATVFVPHTTAGIALQAVGEGATCVATDVEAAMERLVGEDWPWLHTGEGDRNPWSHVRTVLTASSLTIPIVGGDLALGDFQAIFLCEFDGPRARQIHVTVH